MAISSVSVVSACLLYRPYACEFFLFLLTTHLSHGVQGSRPASLLKCLPKEPEEQEKQEEQEEQDP